MNAEKIFADLKQVIDYLDKLSQKYAQIVAFINDSLAYCDGCGKPDFKETMKTISAPFGGDTIYICHQCWNEFLRES
jgi:hypothetical protein